MAGTGVQTGQFASLSIGAIVWGVCDVRTAVKFWCAALDYVVRDDVSDDWAVLLPRSGVNVQLSISKVTSPHARRHHIDLFTDDRERETARLLSLGATRKPWNYPAGADYTVLLDLAGNPFCVVRK